MNQFKLRNAFVIGSLAGAMALASTGCNDTEDTGSTMNSGTDHSANMDPSTTDRNLLARIEADLAAEGSFSASDIDVTLANGVATLTGSVSDAAAKSAAERSARDVEGVQRVRNDLTISTSSTASRGADNDYENSAEATADKVGDVMSDSWITTKVKAELLSDDISSGFEVGVDTVDGWVTLSGQLGNREAVDHIRDLVRNVEGVRGVDISKLNVVAGS